MKKTKRIFLLLLAVVLLFTNAVPAFAASKNSSSTPSAPTLGYSPTTPTNGNVTVTIYYPSTAATRQYRLGTSGSWMNYTSSVIITSNTYICAQYKNSSGTWSALGGVTISNIDKTPPALPLITASSTAPTNQDITMTIGFSSDSTVKQYKIGSAGTWANYTVPVVFSANNTLYAQASDAVGNWTSVANYSVNNIDKTAPAMPILTADNLNPTNGAVHVTISYPSDASVQQFKIGTAGNWTQYYAPVEIGESTILFAKAQDPAGNWSLENSLSISNIDTVAPDSPTFTASTTAPTNQNVMVTVDYSSDAAIRQVMTDGSGIWTDYTSPLLVEANGILHARASDIAGNWSPEASYEIANIDKTPPADPAFTASISIATNQDITVDILYSADSASKQFRIGESGLWTDYSGPVILTANTVVYAKAVDAVGNWTSDSSYIVSNIDKTAPESPLISVSTVSPTGQPIIVTVNFSSDSILKQYKLGLNGSWTDYIAPITVSSNNMVIARSADAASNWSPEASYTISNIVSGKFVVGYTVKYYSTDVSSYNSIVANSSALNEIATATYTVSGTGALTGTAPAEQISYANNNGIRPNLMVSNSFDAAIAKQLLESTANRQNLINSLLNLLSSNNYKGVDIDIENIPAADRSYFTTFMSEVYSTLKPLGYGVSVAVQAKAYDSPNASWNYAFDYKSLAMYSDYLMLMAYDEHYPGGTPGAVASIDWVTSVVNYALTVVPKEKIVLGLAAYGYDWAGSTTKSYSVNACINLAVNNGSTIYFDSVTKSKYFTYTVSGVSHTVWFEDGDTIAYKLDLVNSKDIKGIGIWRLGLENTAYWSTIKAKLNK